MAHTAEQVYALARYAGLTRGRAVVATAIAGYQGSPNGGESGGGNPNAHNFNPSTGDDSWGLWQINMLGALGPARRIQFGIGSNAELLKPGVNAKAMAQISSRGLNFRPWSVYKSGDYKPNLAGAEAAAAKVENMSPIEINRLTRAALAGTSGEGLIPELDPNRGPLDAIAALGSALQTAYKWLPGGPAPSAEEVTEARHGLLRIGFVVGGSILIIMGITAIVGPLVKPLVKAAQKIPGSPIPG